MKKRSRAFDFISFRACLSPEEMLVDRRKTRALFIYYTPAESNRRDYEKHMLGIGALWGLRQEWATPQLRGTPLVFSPFEPEKEPLRDLDPMLPKLLHYADSRVDLYCAPFKSDPPNNICDESLALLSFSSPLSSVGSSPGSLFTGAIIPHMRPSPEKPLTLLPSVDVLLLLRSWLSAMESSLMQRRTPAVKSRVTMTLNGKHNVTS